MTWLFLSKVFLHLCYPDICLLLFSRLVCPTVGNLMTAASQASLSFAISQSLLKLMSTELMMPFPHSSLYHRERVSESETKEVSNTLVKEWVRDFPGGPVVMNLPSNSGDASLIPGWGAKIPTCRGASKSMRCNEELTQPIN